MIGVYSPRPSPAGRPRWCGITTSSSSAAGLAGSAAAIHLARAGAAVLLADRSRFPRDKPCGGGVTGRALRQAPCGISPVGERIVDTFQLRSTTGASWAVEQPCGDCMTQRRRLDDLVQEAVAAGAEFRDGARVEEIGLEGGVTATVGGDRVAADVLVGADGANGVVAKTVGLAGRHRARGRSRGQRPVGAARPRLLRVDCRGGVSAPRPGATGGCSRGGYHANLGVGGWSSEGPRLRRGTSRGSHAPSRSTRRRSPTCAAIGFRRAALALRARPGTVSSSSGDAAGGLVHPRRAHGMTRRSTRAGPAADVIVAGDTDGYADRLAQSLDRPRRERRGRQAWHSIGIRPSALLGGSVAGAPGSWPVSSPVTSGTRTRRGGSRGLHSGLISRVARRS